MAVTGASDGELLTLTASDGGGLAFFGVDLINTSDTAQSISFIPTTLNGTASITTRGMAVCRLGKQS